MNIPFVARLRTRSLPPLALAGAAFLAVWLAGSAGSRPAEARTRIAERFERLPLSFVENRGQTDARVRYTVEGRDRTLYFTSKGVTYALAQRHGAEQGRQKPLHPSGRAAPRAQRVERWVVKLDFQGANSNAALVAEQHAEGKVSFFRGRQAAWEGGLPTYSRLVYRDLWPGIDLVYSGTMDRLKYEYRVRPGADPAQIRLAYRGALSVRLDADGQLVVDTPAGSFTDQKPLAYQQVAGRRVEVASRYELAMPTAAGAGYHFRLGDYDPTRPLIIDPTQFIYCGYIGGSGDDAARGIAVDAAGSAYVVGDTVSSVAQGFPAQVGPSVTYRGTDMFVAKLSRSGGGLVYCGYIGGSGAEGGYGIAIDADGAAYVVGSTTSSPAQGFPVVNGPGTAYSGGTDAFVAKVNPDGTALEYCGYVGGAKEDQGRGIAVDAQKHAYITGFTASNAAADRFPAVIGPRLNYTRNYDAFVAEIKTDGSGLEYCGYVGGVGDDTGAGIAVDGAGNAYITGRTTLNDLPTLVGPRSTESGLSDAFVAKVNAGGASLAYCGFVGDPNDDEGTAIAVDASGAAYIAGSSNHGGWDAFVAKVSVTGASLEYTRGIGGRDWDFGYGVAVDGTGNAYLCGFTEAISGSVGFPVLDGPDLTNNFGGDGFVAKVNPAGTALVYCGYVGGGRRDDLYGIAVDAAGNAYVAGATTSTEAAGFPVRVGPDLTHNDGVDAFVAKIGETPADVTAPVMSNPALSGMDSNNVTTLSVDALDEGPNDTGVDFIDVRVTNPDGTLGSTTLRLASGTARNGRWSGIYRALDRITPIVARSYSATLVAFDVAGNRSAPLGPLLFPPPAAPRLTAAPTSQTEVTLNWILNSSNEIRVEVERKTGAGSFAQIASLPAGSVSYVDGSAETGVTYTYRVRVADSIGPSDYSNTASATPPTDPPPAAPTGLAVIDHTQTSLTISWDSPSEGNSGYKIEHSTNGGGSFVPVATVGVGASSYTETGLNPNQTVFYRIRAFSPSGNSPYSGIVRGTTLPSPPTAPLNLVIVSNANSSFTLFWTDTANNESGFKVERRDDAGPFVQIGTTGQNGDSFTDPGRSVGVSYTYRVRAFNSGGDSAYSNELVATLPNPPAAPTSLVATATNQTTVVLSWSDNSANEQGFKIERSDDGGGTFHQIATSGINEATYTDIGLTKDTSYFYRVRAFNAGGNSAYTDLARIRTAGDPPAAPTDLVIVSLRNAAVTLFWSDQSSVEDGFQLERKVGAGSFALLVSTGQNGDHAADEGLTPGETYTYRVRAYNRGGFSAYSNEASITLPTLPAAPSGLQATVTGSSSVGLTWIDNSGNETGFRIERSDNGGASYSFFKLLESNETSYTDTGLTPDTPYIYRVRAINGSGVSAPSEGVAARTLP
jgi:hypothetical protein